MINRRRLLAGVGAGVLAASAGCVDLVAGDGLELEAAPAAPSDGTVAGTNFELAERDSELIEEDIEVLGQERRLVAETHFVTYEATESIGGQDQQAALFATVSTPGYEVAGQQLNPIARLSHADLVEGVADREVDEDAEDELEELEERESYEETILGESVEVSVFETETEVEGARVTLFVHVATVEHEDDVIALVGTYPEVFPEYEAEIAELLRSVEHPA